MDITEGAQGRYPVSLSADEELSWRGEGKSADGRASPRGVGVDRSEGPYHVRARSGRVPSQSPSVSGEESEA